jgi:SulP family sulfate permease
MHSAFSHIRSFLLRPKSILQNYRREDMRPDLVAGLTVAVVLLPQAIAYALVAELPPQTGLFAAIVAAIVGALWGSSTHLHTGPTNAASLLVLSTLILVVPAGTPEYLAAAGLMAVMVGVARLVMGFARLGVVVNFVSDSVVIGFTAGAGILISLSQLRHLLRLDIASSPALFNTLIDLGRHLGDSHPASLAIGLGVILLMALLRRLRPKWPAALIAMVLAAGLTALLGPKTAGLAVLGELPRSLPPLASLPLLDLTLVGRISTGALAISAIGLVEAISIARSIAARSGQRLNSNQEFVGQGLANIAAGFFSGYTVSGSFTRTAVSYASGGRTQLASVFSGLWILAAMLLLAPLGRFIPKAALAGVLVVTAYGMVDRKTMRRIWHASRGDSAIMVATILATLVLPLEFAVLAGMLISFMRYIIKTSTPDVYPVVPDPNFHDLVRQESTLPCLQLGVMTIGGSLYFGATQHIETCIYDSLEKHPEQKYLLLRMSLVDHCDISGIHMLEAVVRTYRQHGGDVYFAGLREAVKTQMASVGFDAFIGDNHYLNPREAINHLFHKVLDPSVCIYECDRRVFAECQALPKYPYEEKAHMIVELTEHLVPQWKPSEALARLYDPESVGSPLLVDVREESEYDRGHIPHTHLIPLRMIRDIGTELPKDRPLIFVCRSGRRSIRAASIMQDLGYTNVFNLKGGMLAWEAAGYPIAVE